MRPLGLALCGMLVAATLTGCASDPNMTASSSTTVGDSPYSRGDLGTLTYRAVDLLVASAPKVSSETPMLVSSIASTENLEATSPLGNIVSDMIRTRLSQDGYTNVEFRLRREISFKNGGGEFLLSRNHRALLPASSVAAVVLGTYAASWDRVYVSLKLVSAMDGRILSGADFVVPTRQVGPLLGGHT